MKGRTAFAEAMIRLAPIPFPRHIRHHEPDMSVTQPEDVVEVPRHPAGGKVTRGDPEPVSGELSGREEALLDRAGQLQLLLGEFRLLPAGDALRQALPKTLKRVHGPSHEQGRRDRDD